MAKRRAWARIGLNVGLDGVIAALAVPLARLLADPGGDIAGPLWAWAWSALAVLLAGAPFRMSVQYWRFTTTSDLIGVAAGSAAGAALFSLGLHLANSPVPSPAFPAILALCLVVLLGLSRMAYRVMKEGAGEHGQETAPVLLVGAGEGADLFLRALAGDRQAPYRVVGLLSLGQAQTGRRMHGCPILGAVDDAAEVLARLRAEAALPGTLVVTEADFSGQNLARLIAVAEREGVRVARAPRPTTLDPTGRRAAVELRPVAIEDLLNRPQVPLDRAGMARLIQGRRVLVTGAGGTIGSELARQVAALGPEKLLLLDNGEYALWQIDLELAESHAGVPRQPVIADIRDEARLREVMETFRPDLVFHAAALKHVPMVEANPGEGLLTNAAGTRIVADAARAAGAAAMVLISTDKAVNPSSVMGASKRLAELYCQGLDRLALRAGHGMRGITVRFGNVLGSTGSVVPTFQRQLARGGPITVTHPDMERYFMTVREAVGLVLQAMVVGLGQQDTPESGIFVLDMGEPVKIVDLARQMVRLAGLRPDEDISIAFTGLRPGEKLYEELFHEGEKPVPTGTPGLLMAPPRIADPSLVAHAIDEIATACRSGRVAAALTMLGRLVPEFAHNEDGGTPAIRPGVHQETR